MHTGERLRYWNDSTAFFFFKPIFSECFPAVSPASSPVSYHSSEAFWRLKTSGYATVKDWNGKFIFSDFLNWRFYILWMSLWWRLKVKVKDYSANVRVNTHLIYSRVFLSYKTKFHRIEAGVCHVNTHSSLNYNLFWLYKINYELKLFVITVNG